VVVACFGPITTTSGAWHGAPQAWDIVAGLLCLNGFLAPTLLGPTWSLSAEAFFYVTAPVLTAIKRPMVAGLVIASGLLYWFNTELRIGPLADARYGLAAFSLFWAWGLGFLAYRLPPARNLLHFCVLAGAGILLLHGFNNEGGTFSAVTFLATACTVAFGGWIALRTPLRAVLNYLGDLSYPLYLLHYPIILYLNGVLGVRSYAAIFAAVILGSALCHHAIDRPLRRMIARRRLFLTGMEAYAPWLAALIVLAAFASWAVTRGA
jgi:peptidoglycan/LPS O-acetylase OafA/YrhL